MAKIVDLSKPIKTYKDDPFYMKVKIKHKPHKKSNFLIKFFLKLPTELFPKNFIGWADDTIEKMGVHSTTHIDAPWHYSPEVAGKPAATIDKMPLEYGYGDGVVIDMSHKKDNEIITKEDIVSKVEELKIDIKKGNIVLIKTGRDKLIGTKKYPESGTGMSREATEWIIDRGVKVMGIDQWGWDLPLKYAVKRAKTEKDSEFFWQGHMVGAEKEYYHMEQLVNLDKLPVSGFKIAVFPLNIVGASAAPARVVAIFEE
jgi:kynurenine formamidase